MIIKEKKVTYDEMAIGKSCWGIGQQTSHIFRIFISMQQKSKKKIKRTYTFEIVSIQPSVYTTITPRFRRTFSQILAGARLC